MASIYDLKPRFQRLLQPIVNWLAKIGVTANQVTITALVISLLTGIWLTLNPSHFMLLVIPLVMLIRMALNAIDGMLARQYQMKSNLGLILNEFGDIVSDTALYLPFALIDTLAHNSVMVIIVVILSILTETMGIMAVQIGAARRYDGPMGKSDRTFAFSLLAIILSLGHSPFINIVSTYLIDLMVILLAVTIIQRAKNALREVTV